MDENEKLTVDINTAEIDELTQIPGIGPELASRIVAGRPYQVLEDLERVSGISTVFIEGIAPYVDLPSAPVESGEEEPEEELEVMPEYPEAESEEETREVPPPEEQDETLETSAEVGEEALEEPPEPEEEVEPVEAIVPVVEEVLPEEPASIPEESEAPEEVAAVQEEEPAVEGETAPTPVFTRAQTVWITLVGMFFTLVLSLLLSLGILAGVNSGRLQFASPAQVNQLSARAESLRTAIDTNAQDIDSLRKRVDNLDALSGRVDSVEQDVEQIGSSMEAVTAQVGELDQQVGELADQIDTLQEKTDRFSNFLSGLMELMNSLFTPEEGGK